MQIMYSWKLEHTSVVTKILIDITFVKKLANQGVVKKITQVYLILLKTKLWEFLSVM